MANYGIKITRPGYDVDSATDRQIAFTSQYYPFKIVGSFHGSFTSYNSTSSQVSSHALPSPFDSGSDSCSIVGFARVFSTDNGSWSCPTGYAMLTADEFPTTAGGSQSLYGYISCRIDRGENTWTIFHDKPARGLYDYTFEYTIIILDQPSM